MPMGTRTTGPIHLFVRFRSSIYPQQSVAGSGTGPFYLGTCVAAPEPEHTLSEIPILNDISGRNEPLQIVKDGENAVVMATMNRFDWLLLQSIRALASSNTPNAAPLAGNLAAGSEAGFTRGTFVIGVTDFQLIVWWEYAGVAGAAGTATDQLPIRQYNSVTMPKYKESTVGTRVLEVACAFKCNSVYNFTTINFAGGSGNTAGGLYTENPARLGGVTTTALAALVAASGG